MLSTRSPNAVLHEQISKLATCLPGVREGRNEAIHEARVTTRRIRETLALVGDHAADGLSGTAEAFRRIGRALGEARDADVSHDLLGLVERRVPTALTAIAALRNAAARARQTTRRRVIKEFEAWDFPALQRQVAHLQRWDRFVLPIGRRRWQERLQQHVAERAADVRRSIDRAGGVYFPNRSHAARLAIKKLRYALELAHDTGAWPMRRGMRRGMRRLRKAQSVLGQAHDCHVLRASLEALPQDERDAEGAAIGALVTFLEAETLAKHDRYLRMRADLGAICDACERFASPRRRVPALLATGLALHAVLLLGRRQPAPTVNPQRAPDDLRVRVRVS